MEQVQTLIAQIMLVAPAVAAIIMGLISVAEIAVRLTPTEKDDGAVHRIGDFFEKLFNLLKVPNYKKDGGSHTQEPKQ